MFTKILHDLIRGYQVLRKYRAYCIKEGTITLVRNSIPGKFIFFQGLCNNDEAKMEGTLIQI